MPDYKEMYFKMFHATEKAANILIEVQRECEELYMANREPELKIIPLTTEDKKSVDEASN